MEIPAASNEGTKFKGPPTMSGRAMTLTSYNTKEVQNCTRAARVGNDSKSYPDLKLLDGPGPSLTKMPRIPAVLFPEDRLPRPAVIGVVGSYGSYPDSATAIKEILSSVLKRRSSIKSMSRDARVQDSDLANGEDSSPSVNNENSDGDHNGIPILPHAQKDIGFCRHTAAWDNSQLESTNNTLSLGYFPCSPRAPITSPLGISELAMSPNLKCNQCTEPMLPSSEFVPPLNLHVGSQKEKRRFSTSSIALNVESPHNPPLEKFIAPGTKATTVDDLKSFHRRSQSCSNLYKVAENSPPFSSDARHRIEEDLFEPAVNLEKENEHFLAADHFISLVEMMKSNWQYEQWKTGGGMPRLKNMERTPFRRQKTNSESAISVDSGYEGVVAFQNSPAETIFEEEEEEKEEDDNESSSTLSYEIFEDYEDYVIIEMARSESKESMKRTDPPDSYSAEKTARNLYRAFRPQWTSTDGDMQLPERLPMETLCSRSHPNTIPEEFESSVSLVQGFKLCKIRETGWTPPRFEIITKLHPYKRRDKIVQLQNYLCAGCGTKVEPRYTNRLRYCDYLGKYFCDCCHHYAESSIPGRILSNWNFSKYYVSNFSKNFLDKLWDNYTFNVESENPAVYKKVKELNKVKEVQQQLIHIRKLVMTCRFADDGILQAFKEVPSFLTLQLHLFTLADLDKVKKKTLLPSLRELLALALAHVKDCKLCSVKGFICEFCQDPNVLFPFQTEICRRCEACRSCYHKKCFKTDCPKCLRIKARIAQYSDSPFTSSGEVESDSTLVQ